MFGYVTINWKALASEERARFRAWYCGMCRALGDRYGLSGRMTLSYDMTFLAMLLNSLYEPEETTGRERCPAKPLRTHEYAFSEASAYAADMNIAYAYWKAADDEADDRSAVGRAQRALLEGRYARVQQKYPKKIAVVRECVKALSELERDNCPDVDPPANEMGRLFGEVYAWREDFWEPALRTIGASIGRYVYLCDAWEDRIADERKKRYNAWQRYAQRPDYEEFVKKVLTMMLGDGASAFESLPLVKDASILRNILYSGVWFRYATKRARDEKRAGRNAGASAADLKDTDPKRRTET